MPVVRSTPERRCVGCGQRMAKSALARFVAIPDGPQHRLERDDRGINPGRGVYTCRNRACFDRAVVRRAFARGVKLSAARLVVDDRLADPFDDRASVLP